MAETGTLFWWVVLFTVVRVGRGDKCGVKGNIVEGRRVKWRGDVARVRARARAVTVSSESEVTASTNGVCPCRRREPSRRAVRAARAGTSPLPHNSYLNDHPRPLSSSLSEN